MVVLAALGRRTERTTTADASQLFRRTGRARETPWCYTAPPAVIISLMAARQRAGRSEPRPLTLVSYSGERGELARPNLLLSASGALTAEGGQLRPQAASQQRSGQQRSGQLTECPGSCRPIQGQHQGTSGRKAANGPGAQDDASQHGVPHSIRGCRRGIRSASSSRRSG